MKNMKDYLQTKSFIINPGIIKNISKLDISLDEFLLILFFINISNKLDLETINKYTNFSNEHILELFASLSTKGFIELKTIEIAPNKRDEFIDLDVFYDKLIMNDETIEEEKSKNNEEVSSSLCSVFESEFGRTLSPIEYETIKGWVSSGVSEDLIKEALKEAVLAGVTTIRYIEAIIREWSKNGGKKSVRKRNEDESYNEILDYDWLDTDEE